MPKRKKDKEIKVNTAFMLEPSFVEKIDYYADKIGISRSLLIRNCVVTSLDDLALLDKAGIISAYTGGRKVLEYAKTLLKQEALNGND